jgi:hypothetical protein
MRPRTPQGVDRPYSPQSGNTFAGNTASPLRQTELPFNEQPSSSGGPRNNFQDQQHIMTGLYRGAAVSSHGIGGPYSASAATTSSAGGAKGRVMDDGQPLRASTSPAASGLVASNDRGYTDSSRHLRVVTASSSSSSSKRFLSDRGSTSPTNMVDPYNVPLPQSDNSHSRHDHSSATSLQHGNVYRNYDSPSAFGQAGGSASVPAPLGRPQYQDHHGSSSSRNIASGSGSGSVTPVVALAGSVCGACGKPVKGQFVRAMNKVFHLDCFRCRVRI